MPHTRPSPGTYSRRKIRGAVRGILAAIAESGEPLIDYCGNAGGALVAVSTVVLTDADVGKEAVLLFEDGDPSSPILVGLIQAPGERAAEPGRKLDLTVDGRKLTVSAEQEIVLRCGEASITLTKAGKVLIRGTYVLSRATGPNRVQGGSVHLN
jgi:Domain of unknown function (DUF6484)